MTDRELLEAAAKAAGIEVEWHFGCGNAMAYVRMDARDSLRLFWNPLIDDGDALRLAVRLRLTACGEKDGVVVAENEAGNVAAFEACPSSKSADNYAATRRAIVRAAAAMVSQ